MILRGRCKSGFHLPLRTSALSLTIPLRRPFRIGRGRLERGTTEACSSIVVSNVAMGLWLSKLYSLFGDREARILVLGLDNAGKTTILCASGERTRRNEPNTHAQVVVVEGAEADP